MIALHDIRFGKKRIKGPAQVQRAVMTAQQEDAFAPTQGGFKIFKAVHTGVSAKDFGITKPGGDSFQVTNGIGAKGLFNKSFLLLWVEFGEAEADIGFGNMTPFAQRVIG